VNDTDADAWRGAPASDEQPLFCLVDDDTLITQANVKADRLWNSLQGVRGPVELVIQTDVRATQLTTANLIFGS
jgi:hypothetical protein